MDLDDLSDILKSKSQFWSKILLLSIFTPLKWFKYFEL